MEIQERPSPILSVLNVDGGVRSGLDMVRVLMSGARLERGVAHVLQLIGKGVRGAMALTGVTRVGTGEAR